MTMPVKTRTKENNAKTRGATWNDVPQFFRLNIEGRRQAGSRCYFECGPVTLQVLDVSSQSQPHPAAKALYFTVNDLEGAYERARALNCLSREEVHDAPGGGIVVRPWGERSFYALDPWRNPLCFVEQGTVYTGRD